MLSRRRLRPTGSLGASLVLACGVWLSSDACTVDTCDGTGDAPVCAHETTEGLKLYKMCLPEP